MPYIEIKEQDLTAPTGATESTDVVFIPGFVNLDKEENKNLYDITKQDDDEEVIGDYIGIEVNKPELFTSVTDFEARCGKKGVVFTEDQRYSDLTELGISSVFHKDAIPTDGVMFKAGQADPGYVMAKELLNAGLPVLFQRVNPDKAYEEVPTGKEPSDWATNTTDYEKQVTVYEPIQSQATPFFGFVNAEGTLKGEGQYYKAELVTGEGTKDQDGIPFYKFTKTTLNLETDEEITDSSIFTYDSSLESKFVMFKQVTVTSGAPESSEGKYFDFADGVYTEIKTQPEEWGTSYTTFEKVEIGTPGSDKLDPTNKEKPVFIVKKEEEYYIALKWNEVYSNYYIENTKWEAQQLEDVFDAAASYRKVLSGTEITDMYRALSTIYEATGFGLDDKGNYSIKYLTSGGYPTYEFANGVLVTNMLNLCSTRGDCVAFIDHTNNPERSDDLNDKTNIFNKVKDDDALNDWDLATYGTMFTSWKLYNRNVKDKNYDDTVVPESQNLNANSIMMPASYAYFLALADSIKTYDNWMAIAGVTRGLVPNLASGSLIPTIPNGIADRMISNKSDMAQRAINPITNIRPYGETIWGNRTLTSNSEGVKATSFLNIRNLVSDIKKLVYTTCRRMTYEPNSDQLWVNIQAAITPTLDRMQTGQGISGYQLALNKQHKEWGTKATLCFKIILYPIYPVERFFVDIVLKDDEVEITE